MKSFVIYLPGHKKTEEHLPILKESAIRNKWEPIEFFAGYNGLTTPFPFKIDQRYQKGADQFLRPGVKGCFASHYELWKRCLKLNEPIAIFESDVLFCKGPLWSLKNTDVIKLHGFRVSKPAATGNWHEGAHAYILKPSGAKKLIDWTEKWGASPADYMLGDKVVTMGYDFEDRVKLVDLGSSLTWNLESEMN
jgi:GR25 family glycosyltransferase involved in LPS biosynthesis